MASDDAPLKKFSWEEVAKHSTAESLWVVVHDKVYDVSEFLEEVNTNICG